MINFSKTRSLIYVKDFRVIISHLIDAEWATLNIFQEAIGLVESSVLKSVKGSVQHFTINDEEETSKETSIHD